MEIPEEMIETLVPAVREQLESPDTAYVKNCLERLTGKQTIMGASMHNYRITHPAQSLCVAGRTDDGTIEALEYGEQMLGVQFHPEADDQNDDLFRVVL